MWLLTREWQLGWAEWECKQVLVRIGCPISYRLDCMLAVRTEHLLAGRLRRQTTAKQSCWERASQRHAASNRQPHGTPQRCSPSRDSPDSSDESTRSSQPHAVPTTVHTYPLAYLRTVDDIRRLGTHLLGLLRNTILLVDASHLSITSRDESHFLSEPVKRFSQTGPEVRRGMRNAGCGIASLNRGTRVLVFPLFHCTLHTLHLLQIHVDLLLHFLFVSVC